MVDRADIVVVGAGIAGIAAAQALSGLLPEARILVIDDLPPFSLHARVLG